MKRSYLAIILLCLSSAIFASEMATEDYFNRIQAHPKKLRTFLQQFPKGGDLHYHLSGGAYAENLFQYAANDAFCIDRTYTVVEDQNCSAENLLTKVFTDKAFKKTLIRAWSMQSFKGNNESGHDHFFATFNKFSLLTRKYRNNVFAEIVQRASAQNEQYIELMDTLDGNQSGRLGKQLGYDPDFNVMRDKLLKNDFATILSSISSAIDKYEQYRQEKRVGTDVTVRYLYQVLREQPPEMVFAQLLAGFEAARFDKRVVGLNMVQPEDGALSMQDYSLHMRMIQFLKKLYPEVAISLHAGELSEDLLSKDLNLHINEAVLVANANRIGHAVDILYEADRDTVLKTMANNHIMVEINLSSNDAILNVSGNHHPLLTYLNYGVPVALSTDDEAISRSDLTHEYLRAVTTYHLSYATLKTLARNSLTYAFLPGDSLWTVDNKIADPCAKEEVGRKYPSNACQAFLEKSEKASMQWELERRFLVFEEQYK